MLQTRLKNWSLLFDDHQMALIQNPTDDKLYLQLVSYWCSTEGDYHQLDSLYVQLTKAKSKKMKQLDVDVSPPAFVRNLYMTVAPWLQVYFFECGQYFSRVRPWLVYIQVNTLWYMNFFLVWFFLTSPLDRWTESESVCTGGLKNRQVRLHHLSFTLPVKLSFTYQYYYLTHWDESISYKMPLFALPHDMIISHPVLVFKS